jgi:hypothetical protein
MSHRLWNVMPLECLAAIRDPDAFALTELID